MAHEHCRNYSRSDLLRRAAAEAGRGLPSIEPGMPMPAGTGLSRRSFMLRSGALALSVYGASQIDALGLAEGVAAAAEAPPNAVLVSVFLDGGIDSLSVLAPTGDARYASLRPTLKVGEAQGLPFSEDPGLSWHPAAASLRELHGEGKLTVFPAIGYSDPNQSHFTSRHFYEVGSLRAGERTGWMGRYLDHVGTRDNPLQGLALDGYLAPPLATASKPVAAIEGPRYDLYASGVSGQVEEAMYERFPRLGALYATTAGAMGVAGEAAVQAGRVREQMRPFATGGLGTPVGYPNGEFSEKLKALAAILDEGLPVRCAALRGAGEHDTHANQAEDFTRDLRNISDALLAFQRDLEARGQANRVLVEVWSEFGRRVEENGSRGTDHGAAGIGFLIGNRVRGQMVGEFPGLTKLDPDGNLRATSDFRAVYCSLLEQWFDTDAGAVIPGAAGFGRPALVS
jgi:uncharacterized protein (DUF1501 family)